MRHLNTFRVFIVFNLLILICGSIPVVQAKTEVPTQASDLPAPECYALDLAFVIDQSKDMARLDPDDTRIHAIQWLINLLGYDRLFMCPNSTHRVTVISFSGDAKQENGISNPVTVSSIDVDLTSIRPKGNEKDPFKAWEREYDELAAQITARNEKDRNYDSLLQALSTAADKLNEAPGEGSQPRKKALVLFMGGDGAPCTENQSCAFYAIPGYQKGLKELFAEKLSNVSLWAVTYGNGSDPYKFLPFWNEVTQTFSGKAFLLKKGDIDTAKSLMAIYQSLNPNSNLKEVCGSTFIDPVVERLTFTIFSQKPQSRINFRLDQGDLNATPEQNLNQLLYSTDTSKQPSNDLEYVFKNPIAGSWEFDASCSNKQALMYMRVTKAEHINVLGPLPTEKLPQYQQQDQKYDQNNPYFLRLQVVDADNVPIPDQGQYLRLGTGKVTLPDKTTYDLTFVPAQGRGYISEQALPTNLTDKYEWSAELAFSSADPQLKESKYSIQAQGSYVVSPVTPFTIKLEAPTSAVVMPVHGNPMKNWMKVDPFTVKARLKLLYGNTSSVPLNQAIRGDQGKVIRAVLYHTTSQKQQEIWLEHSKTDPLLYVGNIGDQIDAEGDYSIKLFFNEDTYDKNNFRYVQDEAGSRAEFPRHDGILQNPLLYQVSGAVLSLSVLILFLVWLVNITNPPLGRLVFVAPIPECASFAEIDLSDRKFRRRWVSIKRDDLTLKSHLLKNIDSISIWRNGLFGGDPDIKVIENKTEVQCPTTDHGELEGSSGAGYKIKYIP